MRRNEPEPGHGKAVVRGGCGCLVLTFAALFIAVIVGGTAHADFLGVVAVFVIGAVLGLIVNEIYKRGYRRGYANAEEDELKTTDRRLRRAEREDGADGA